MDQDSLSERRKRNRSRENEESPAPASLKKRRLNDVAASSPSTPKALNAIASAVSSAFGFGRSKNKPPTSTYDVPDSDEEKPVQHSRLARPTGRPAVKAAFLKGTIYDIPDSGDESRHATKGKTQNNESATKRGKGSAHRERSTKTPDQLSVGKRRNQKENIQPVDTEEDGSAATEESPLKVRSSSRRRIPTAKVLEGHLELNGVPSADKTPPSQAKTQTKGQAKSQARPVATMNGARSVKRQLEDHGRTVSSPLKGILTPSKRDKNELRRRKSVAFGTHSEHKEAEVYFEDLPNKAQRKKTKAASPKVAEVAPPETEEESTEEIEADQEDDDDEGEDDEVCAMCAKPDSEPPNEIIFCDGCDMAVHQKCYKIAEVPDGDWLCKGCSKKEASAGLKAGAVVATTFDAAKIPNFEQHLGALQRVLVDRCTGRRRIKLMDQEEAYGKARQLVEQTVLTGEGNSMLVIGARGCGKTTLVESIVSDMSLQHSNEFHVVRLNGFIHTDDKLALKEIWRQLGKEMEVDDDLTAKSNYADTMASLLALLSHPSEMQHAEEGVTSRAVVFIIDEFDMFAAHPRQTLLYNLFDIAQARKAPVAVLGCTTRMDVVEMLEKRVKSRFSHRYIYLSLPKNLPAYWQICKQGLTVDEEDMEADGIDVGLAGHEQFFENWNDMIEELYKDERFQNVLQHHYYSSKSVSAFFTNCILPLSTFSATSPELEIPGPIGSVLPLSAPNSKLHLLSALSELDLALLIAAARLDIIAHTDTVNFAMAYDEYGSLIAKQRVQSATSGMLAFGGGVRVWGRGVAGIAWERLVALGLLVPAGIGSSKTPGHGGLEGKMWKMDLALEDIPAGVKLNNVLAKWCKEI